ncbi:Uncharacterised protein [Mycobacterium tuberculosis]|nr:Uncharacterised protein [Mycobacterium tuberculosis]
MNLFHGNRNLITILVLDTDIITMNSLDFNGFNS